MKLDYYYDEQFRRTLKHLIRLFGEFQVKSGYNTDGTPKYRSVPCRYADYSRQAMYLMNGASENVIATAPIMTISVRSLKMDRQGVRGPVSRTIVMGENISPEVNQYENKLDKISSIDTINPVPWKLTFDLNIWTTSLTAKMELWEQIITLFDPAVSLQYNENPLDWTSLTEVELIDSEFTTRSVPQGTTEELDISSLTFECIIYFSQPAKYEKAKLVKQIVTNMKTSMPYDISFINDAITDVYTPKNLKIDVEQSGDDIYTLTLMPSSNDNKVLSWVKYLSVVEPEYRNKSLRIFLLKELEDSSPAATTVLSIGSGATANKMQVKLDSSSMNTKYVIDGFVAELPTDSNKSGTYIYMGEVDLPNIKIGEMFRYDPTTQNVEIIDVELKRNEYVYNKEDMTFYCYSVDFGWYQLILNTYRAGFWRIAVSD